MEYPGLLDLIIIFADGDPAHFGQCLGVANRLSDLTGAEVASFDVPKLTGTRHFFADKRKIQLLTGRREEVLSWLKYARGEHLLRSVGSLLVKRSIRTNSSKVLMIAAGNEAAAYNLAIASAWNVACSVIGTPKRIGTKPFEFAIIPEYEYPPREPNILKTITPPNNVRRETLREEADKLIAKYRPKSEQIWSVLLGGDDENYCMSADWVKHTISQLIAQAELQDADLYITTSRRTNQACASVLKELAGENNVIRYLHIASEDEDNPVSALIGLSSELFCTEDSVNMVSEAVTGGQRVVLLRTERVKGVKNQAAGLAAALIKRGGLSREYAFGTARYDLIYDRFKRHDKLVEFKDWLKTGRKKDIIHGNLADDSAVWVDFNEARRAAKWIAKSLVV